MTHVFKLSFATLLAVTLTFGAFVLGQPQPAGATLLFCPPPCDVSNPNLVRDGVCVRAVPNLGFEHCKTYRDTETQQMCSGACYFV